MIYRTTEIVLSMLRWTKFILHFNGSSSWRHIRCDFVQHLYSIAYSAFHISIDRFSCVSVNNKIVLETNLDSGVGRVFFVFVCVCVCTRHIRTQSLGKLEHYILADAHELFYDMFLFLFFFYEILNNYSGKFIEIKEHLNFDYIYFETNVKIKIRPIHHISR